VLGVVRWRGDHRPLFVEIGARGVIRAFGGAQGSMVTAGVYVFSTRIFDFVSSAREAHCGALREFLSHLLVNKLHFKAIELGETIDIDEAADLDAARAMLERATRRDNPPKLPSRR
jgi:NDP-sugar pyrophosphorylase family protein